MRSNVSKKMERGIWWARSQELTMGKHSIRTMAKHSMHTTDSTGRRRLDIRILEL